MAATKRRSQRVVRGALTAACAVAGISSSPVEAVELKAASLYYTEPGRVSAFEGVVEGKYLFSEDRSLTAKFGFDSLSGASANGAVPAASVQTFTSPSGESSYNTKPGQIPLDSTFRDTRYAGNAAYAFSLNRLTRLTTGAQVSTETDYLSLGGSVSLERDFNKRNTTLSFTGVYAFDTINPQGGRPEPLSSMVAEGVDRPTLDGNGQKDVADVAIGLTQVFNRSTIGQFNYSFSHVSGYQTDPYKLVSVVNSITGDPVDQVYELRPEARTKHVLFGKVKRHLGRDVLDVSYRFLKDDWGVTSHTVDLNYRLRMGSRFIQPHVRFYRQSAADFYSRWIEDGGPLPMHATADYRLGEMDAWTVGARFGQAITEHQAFVVRLEYYLQSGDSSPPGAPGSLADFDLFPDVEAWILNIGYSLDLDLWGQG